MRFSIRSVLLVTTLCAVSLALLRWLDLSARASLFVVAIAAVSLLAAAALVSAIARGSRPDN
jgi:hypothetical protein